MLKPCHVCNHESEVCFYVPSHKTVYKVIKFLAMFIFVHVFMLSAGENISCVWNAVQSTHCLLISMVM